MSTKKTLSSKLASIVAVLALFAIPAAAQGYADDDLSNLFKKHDLVEVDRQQAMSAAAQSGMLRLAADGQPVDVLIEKRDLRSRRYRAEDQGASGKRDITSW